jgi:hypothetical protein
MGSEFAMLFQQQSRHGWRSASTWPCSPRIEPTVGSRWGSKFATRRLFQRRSQHGSSAESTRPCSSRSKPPGGSRWGLEVRHDGFSSGVRSMARAPNLRGRARRGASHREVLDGGSKFATTDLRAVFAAWLERRIYAAVHVEEQATRRSSMGARSSPRSPNGVRSRLALGVDAAVLVEDQATLAFSRGAQITTKSLRSGTQESTILQWSLRAGVSAGRPVVRASWSIVLVAARCPQV